MKFTPETEVDFLKHEYFVKWVLSPTKESTDYWNRWLIQNPEKAALLRGACDLLLSFQLKETHSMENASYYKILDNLLEENSKKKIHSIEKSGGNSNSWLVAASIILFSSLGFLGYFLSKQNTPQFSAVASYVTESVPKGFKKTIVLPDGSEIKLNSESELRYPVHFSDTLREVYLEGEGFFEVTKNKRAPFIVHTANLATRVVGTSFDIRSYKNEKNEYVAVLTGNVEVTTPAGVAEMLAPLDITTYSPDKKTLKKSTFVADDFLSWRNGVIAFNGATFEEVTTQLSRWYGVDFVIEEGFNVKGHYTGRFEKEALTTVLLGISYSSHFKFHVENKKVFITKPK
jgi:ferric-dicitrate binding protein FerR (iron transport regulator)